MNTQISRTKFQLAYDILHLSDYIEVLPNNHTYVIFELVKVKLNIFGF